MLISWDAPAPGTLDMDHLSRQVREGRCLWDNRLAVKWLTCGEFDCLVKVGNLTCHDVQRLTAATPDGGTG